MSTSKTGKHGHAKCAFVAVDIFTGKKMEDLSPSSHNVDVPHVSRTDYTLLVRAAGCWGPAGGGRVWHLMACRPPEHVRSRPCLTNPPHTPPPHPSTPPPPCRTSPTTAL